MDFFTALDDETAVLILQLQIDDSLELFRLSAGKGKHREGVLPDPQLAFKVYAEDLERILVILQDRRISTSIARERHTEGNTLAVSVAQEQTARPDRELALRLGGTRLPSDSSNVEPPRKLPAISVAAPLIVYDSEDDTLVQPSKGKMLGSDNDGK